MLTPTPAVKAELSGLQVSEKLCLLKLEVPLNTGGLMVFRFCNQMEVTWAGQVWSQAAFDLLNISQSSSGEKNRPSLVLANPDGIFSYYIANGALEGSRVWRYLVHPDELDTTLATQNQWYVRKIASLNSRQVSLELADLSDGNQFKLPPRRFTQPEFRQVSL